MGVGGLEGIIRKICTIVSVLGFIYKRRTPNTAKSTGDSKK